MNTKNNTSSGVGFCSLLGLLFVGLKLGGAIDWSWWYVTMPFYGIYILLALVFSVSLVGGVVYEVFKELTKK